MTMPITPLPAATPSAMPQPAATASGGGFARQLEVAGARPQETPAPDAARAHVDDAKGEPGDRSPHTATSAAENATPPVAKQPASAAPPQPARVVRGDDVAADPAGIASLSIPIDGAVPEVRELPEAVHRAPPRPKDRTAEDDAAPPTELCAWLIHRLPPEAAVAGAAPPAPLRGTRAAQASATGLDPAQALPSAARTSELAAGNAMSATLPGIAAEQTGANRKFADASTLSPSAIGAVETARPMATALQASAAGAAANLLQAELPSAPGTPHFPAALGAQLSTWVRDGVQQARLHLNPADLGPIGVRISLDGTNAQIDFQAAHAATRAALEAAVPSLASALHQSGFTLSGGGVFQQPPHSRPSGDADARGGGHGSHGGRGAAPDGDQIATAPSQGARSIAHRGIVDLYA